MIVGHAAADLGVQRTLRRHQSMTPAWTATIVAALISAACAPRVPLLDDPDMAALVAVKDISDGRRPVCIKLSPTVESGGSRYLGPSAALLDTLRRAGW